MAGTSPQTRGGRQAPGGRGAPGNRLLAALLPLLLAACANFHTVEEGRLYRSAQPTQAQLEEWIDHYKLKTVVRLRGGQPGDREYEWTRRAAENKDINFVHCRLSARRYPKKAELLRLWEVFAEGEYPMLVHCQSGVDRSGLASGVYLLWRTGDVDRAADQLSFRPYFHTGWFGAWKLDEVFRMYRPFADRMTFPEWVRKEYRNPDLPARPDSQPHGESPASRPASRPSPQIPAAAAG